MPRVQLVTPERARREDRCGEVVAFDYFREAAPLQLCALHLGAGASSPVEAIEHDLIGYVWTGSVDARGVTLEAQSSLIVERGGAVLVTAGADGAALLLFAASEAATRVPAGDLVHLLPYERVPRQDRLGGSETVGGALYADACGFSAPLWLHENEFREGGTEVAVHSHSEDEIIFVRDGTIILGLRHYGPGTALAISANTKYGFRIGPDGLSFVNFRASSPTYSSADGRHQMDEVAFWHEAAGTPVYL